LNGFSLALQEDYGPALDGIGLNYLQRIHAASMHMSRLIDDLLKLSRVTRSEMILREVNLSDVVSEISEELQASQPERKVRWIICPALSARADRALMRIALSNLLGNAWKFSSKKAETIIEFGVEIQQTERVFFVRDNGAGFDMAYANKLFREFQRLHAEAEFEGTGIGLALVRRIIHRHGGRVWAEGAIDQGATIYFTLVGE
jgi:light-regulated signal transduction histidine kinase (bacteriophytochrome)